MTMRDKRKQNRKKGPFRSVSLDRDKQRPVGFAWHFNSAAHRLKFEAIAEPTQQDAAKYKKQVPLWRAYDIRVDRSMRAKLKYDAKLKARKGEGNNMLKNMLGMVDA
jgi:hypothetical protein